MTSIELICTVIDYNASCLRIVKMSNNGTEMTGRRATFAVMKSIVLYESVSSASGSL